MIKSLDIIGAFVITEKGQVEMEWEQGIYEAIKYLNCLFEVFLIYYFLESLFPIYEERKCVRIAEIAAGGLILYGINRLGIPEWNLIGVFLVDSCLAWLLFHRGLRATVPYIVLCVVILSLTEFIFHYIYRLTGIDYKEPGIKRIIMLLVQDIFRFLLFELLRKNNSRVWQQQKQVKGYWRFLFLLPISTILLLNGIVYFENFPIGYCFICLGGILLILSNVGGFFIVEKILEVMGSLREIEQGALKTELEQKHYQKMEQINEEYAQYVHDIRKTARVVQQLAEQGNHEEICRIAFQLQGNDQLISSKLYCTDKIVNAILLDREKTAEQENVSFDIKIQPGLDVTFLEELDRIILFGNLLDNAIEAASKMEQGYVKVDIYMGNRAMLVCRIENNFKILPKKRTQEYLSNKEGFGHGYGLKNVRRTAEKYHGSLYLEEQGQIFVAVLTLSNVQKMES